MSSESLFQSSHQSRIQFSFKDASGSSCSMVTMGGNMEVKLAITLGPKEPGISLERNLQLYTLSLMLR